MNPSISAARSSVSMTVAGPFLSSTPMFPGCFAWWEGRDWGKATAIFLAASDRSHALVILVLSVLFFVPHEASALGGLKKRNNDQDQALVAPPLTSLQTGTRAEKTAAYWNNVCAIVNSLNALDGAPVADRSTLQGGNKMLALGSKPISKTVKWLNELPKDEVDPDAMKAANQVMLIYSAFAKHFAVNDGGMGAGAVALDGAIAGAKTYFSGQNPFEVWLGSFTAFANLVKELEKLQEQLSRIQKTLESRYTPEGVKLNPLKLY